MFPSLDLLLILDVAAGDVVADLDFALQEQASVSSLANGAARPTFRRLR